jgi:transcriptional regulator with XRE-family HTH domain
MASKNPESSASMRMFGTLVRAYREAAGKSVDELADYAGWSRSTVIKVERGERMPPPTFVERATEFLSSGQVLYKASVHIERTRYPEWFEDYVDVEQSAVSLYTYSTLVFHGLLQTEEYARAVLTARCPVLEPEEIDTWVESRMLRQGLLLRVPHVQLTFVIEEGVLRRTVAGTEVQRTQLARLLDVEKLRNVTIQVVPLTCPGHAGLDGPMHLLETPEREQLAYLEVQEQSILMSQRDKVSALNQRYAMIRSQALSPRESVEMIETIAGEL